MAKYSDNLRANEEYYASQAEAPVYRDDSHAGTANHSCDLRTNEEFKHSSQAEMPVYPSNSYASSYTNTGASTARYVDELYAETRAANEDYPDAKAYAGPTKAKPVYLDYPQQYSNDHL